MNDKTEFHIKISIFHKIIIYVTILVSSAIGINTYISVKEETKILTEGLIHSAKYTARAVALSTESAFGSLNWIFVEKLLKEIKQSSQKEIVASMVVKPDGEIYLASEKQYYGETVDPSTLFQNETLLNEFFIYKKQEKGMLLVRPVSIGNETWYVMLWISQRPITAAIKTLIIRNISWGLLIIVLAFFGSFFLAKSISRPIINLAENTKSISLKNLNQKIEILSNDEIGLLSHAFNQMIGSLKVTTEELEVSEQRYKTLIETASKAGIGIVVLQNDKNKKGIVKYVNQGLIDMSGYTREELFCMPFLKLVHPDNQHFFLELFTKVSSDDTINKSYRFIGVNKSLEKIPIEISSGVTNFEGQQAFVLYAKNISIQLEAEKQLKDYSANLEAMVKAKTTELQKTLYSLQNTQSQLLQAEKLASVGQLAAGVAHEINNPVGFVKSNLGTMEEYRLDLTKLLESYAKFESITMETEKINEIPSIKNAIESTKKIKEDIDFDFILDDYPGLIEDSKEGMERVAKIVADLKNFVHMDKAKLEYANINHGIESTLNIVGNELKYKAKVIKDLGDLPLVKCYPQQLNQIFANLLVNAAHAIEKEGEIRIFTAKDKDRVIIKIGDTGCGIPQNIIDKIYDPFFTTKEVGKGTGLGLNVVYNIIQTHQGTIDIESQVGKGSTFIITLPIEPAIVENQAV
jgi:two-component system NtrC family sensor kinase